MNRGRRKIVGKFFVDLSKYSATILLGVMLIKAETLTPALAWKGLGFSFLLLLLGWFIFPKGDE